MPNQIMYFSRFRPTYEMGGGARRMTQLYEMLLSILPEMQLISTQRNDRIPKEIKKKIKKLSNREDFFAPTRWSLGIRKWSRDHIDMTYRLLKYSKIWLKSIGELPQLDLAIMDEPIYFLPLFKKLIELGIPVIGISQNIETLASGQVKEKWLLDMLMTELKILKQCRLVITISREEDILLSNLGIRSLYIPYFPIEPIYKRLIAIRESRKHSEKDGVLMVGSSRNLPTRYGMQNAASFWEKNRMDQYFGKLIIGGYKSEMYFDPSPYPLSTDFRGTLENEALDALLTRIRVFLCYQKTGAGGLTRINEMLIAGVPVLANTHAARSYYNLKGLTEFREFDDLEKILKSPDIFNDEIFLPQQPSSGHLEKEIYRILK